MPAPPNSIVQLMARLRRSDEQAAQELVARYSHQLLAAAEKHLSGKLARRLYAEDVVQSAFRSFFQGCAAGQFQVDVSGQLWGLLLQITLRKAMAQARKHTAAIRDVGAEIADGDKLLREVVSREPGPEEAAILSDFIQTLLDGFPASHRQMFELMLQGCKTTEIATQLGLSRQYVSGVVGLLKDRLERSAAES